MEHLYPQPFPVQRDSQGGAGPGCGARRVCGGLSFGGPLPAAVTEASVDSGCSGRPRAVTSVGRVPLCKGKTSGRAPRLPPNHLAPKTHPCRRGCVWGGYGGRPHSLVNPLLTAAPRAAMLRGSGPGAGTCSRSSPCPPPVGVQLPPPGPWTPVPSPARLAGQGCGGRLKSQAVPGGGVTF